MFPIFSVLCSQGRQTFQSPMFPGLRVWGSLEAGIMHWEQRYGPSATSGDLRGRPCADMAEKRLYYSLLPPRHIVRIRCVTERKDPERPHLPVSSRVILGSVLVHTHNRFVRRGQIISSLLRAGSSFLNSLSFFFFNKAREAFAFLLFNMSVLPFKHGPVYHQPCRNPLFLFFKKRKT